MKQNKSDVGISPSIAGALSVIPGGLALAGYLADKGKGLNYTWKDVTKSLVIDAATYLPAAGLLYAHKEMGLIPGLCTLPVTALFRYLAGAVGAEPPNPLLDAHLGLPPDKRAELVRLYEQRGDFVTGLSVEQRDQMTGLYQLHEKFGVTEFRRYAEAIIDQRDAEKIN